MNIGVIFAGGVGSRMNSRAKPKQFLMMHGKPIIIHTIEIFEANQSIDAIVVSCVKDWIPHMENLIRKYNLQKVVSVVEGGKTGQLSIYNGLVEAERISGGENGIVLIHDGVRPLITQKTIDDNIETVKRYGSAITCVKVKETVILVNDNEAVDHIPDRDCLRLARAPQSFRLENIISAHRKALDDGIDDFVDSCTMMQHYGNKLYLIEGPQENIKVTTPDDFYIMRAILDAKENSQIYGLSE